MHLVEGSSADLIPKMKEEFGMKSLDLVFLDHWKDRYLPDTKLMEAGFMLTFLHHCFSGSHTDIKTLF